MRYRGYKIEDLAEHSSFMECCYLLLYGDLPSKKDLVDFEEAVIEEMVFNQKGYGSDLNMKAKVDHTDEPMAIMCILVASLSTDLVEKEKTLWNLHQMDKVAIQLIAKFATLTGMVFRKSLGLEAVTPRRDMTYTENLMNMLY